MSRRILLTAIAAALAATAFVLPGAQAQSTFVPRAGTDPATVDLSRVSGAYRLPEGGTAVPVKATPPSWLTEDLLASAAVGPTALPANAAVASLPASGYVGIGPGSEMVFPSGCTMNFVFGTPGNYSIGTAGHCVEKTGQPVTLLLSAPPNAGACVLGAVCTPVPVLLTIGTVSKLVNNGVGADFALVSIKPELQSWVRTTIPQVLGPCGKYTGDGFTEQSVPFQGHATLDAGEQIFHYGHGVGIGTGGTSRTGHALYWEPKAFWWAGSVVFGDSGSAARTGTANLKAAGDVTHLIIFDGRHIGATAAGTRAAEMERIAGKPIANSPYCV